MGAAERVFADKGPELATMEDVAQAADVGKGTLYLYFDSKDALFLEIANRTLRELVEATDQCEAGARSGRDRLNRLLGTIASFGLAHPDRFRLVLNWMVSGATTHTDTERFAEYRALVGGVLAALAGAIEAGKQDQTIVSAVETPSLVAEALGAILGGLLIEMNARAFAQRMPPVSEWTGMTTGIVKLVLAGVRGADGMPPLDPTSDTVSA